MSGAQPWVVVGLTSLNIIVVVVLGLYVNGPRRKRLLDEIALRDATLDPEARGLLDLHLQRRLTDYARRRAFGVPSSVTRRVVVFEVVVLVASMTIAFTLERGRESVALVVGVGVGLGCLVFLERQVDREKSGAFDAATVAASHARRARGPHAKRRSA